MKIQSKVVFSLVFAIILIFLISNTSAGLGTASKTYQGWKKIYSTDDGYFTWIDEQNKQKTEICLLSENATKLSDLPLTKYAYFNQNMTEYISLNRKIKKSIETGLTKDYYGYCRVVDTETYLKFGEHSTLFTYQNESRITYNLGEYYLDITLLKNEGGQYTAHPETIFVYYTDHLYKFGADDSDNTGLESYRYQITSNKNIYFIGEELYLDNGDETHIIDFYDICLKSGADCSFTQIDANTINLDFNSDANIDPIIQVSTSQSFDMDVEPMDNNRFIVAIAQNSSLKVLGYYVNGTLIFDKTSATNIGQYSRVDISRINSSTFAVGYLYSNNGGQKHYFYMNMSGYNTTDIFAETVGTPNIDLELVAFNNNMVMCHIEDSTNNIHATIFNYSLLNNGTETTIDVGVAPTLPLQNLVQCKEINSTAYAVTWFNDASNNVYLAVYSNDNIQLLANQNLDTSSGEQVNVDVETFTNSRIFVSWIDDGIGDALRFTGHYANGTTFLPDVTAYSFTDTDSYISSASIIDNSNNEYYVIAWHDRAINMINASVYYLNGTLLRNLNLATDVNSTNIVFNIMGDNIARNYGNYNDTFYLAYTNSSGLTKIVSYYLNGTIVSSTAFDFDNPSVVLNTPEQNYITNISNINFTANATDNSQLATAKLVIYNSSSVITNSTINISGISSLVGIVHNFISEGLYFWYYVIKDTNNNFIKSAERNVTYDASKPIISYVYPTEYNNSLVFFDHINVNVSIYDLSPTNTTIFFYSGNSTNYSLYSTYTTNNNIADTNFSNLPIGSYFFNVSSCDYLNYCSYLPKRFVTAVNFTLSDVSLQVTFSDYPYIELNDLLNISAQLMISDVYSIASANVTMTITELNGSKTSFPLYYQPSSQSYENAVIFTQVGDYPFIINASAGVGINLIETGMFRVRIPFYVTFEAYTDVNNKSYINNFAYLTAEISDPSFYDANIEPFVAGIRTSDPYALPVWYAPYQNGQAVLKLWEANETYMLRLRDGQIYFSGNYAVPQVIKGYGTNIVLGQYTFDGDTTLKVLVTNKDLHPYFWLANILLVIGLIGCFLLSIALFFMIPRFPFLAIGFFFISVFGLLGIRLLVWWMGGV